MIKLLSPASAPHAAAGGADTDGKATHEGEDSGDDEGDGNGGSVTQSCRLERNKIVLSYV